MCTFRFIITYTLFLILLCRALFNLSSSKYSLWGPMGFVSCLLFFLSGWLNSNVIWISFLRSAHTIKEWSSFIILHHGSRDCNPLLWTSRNLLSWCLGYSDLNILSNLSIHCFPKGIDTVAIFHYSKRLPSRLLLAFRNAIVTLLPASYNIHIMIQIFLTGHN